MTQHIVKINSIKHITHDVLKIVAEKLQMLTYTPGQATEVSINENGWKNEKRPFTFTSLPDNDYIEFTIKTYPSHKGVTANEFKKLLDNNFIKILSDEKVDGYAHGKITESFLKANSSCINQNYYVCGPPPMIEAAEKQLIHLKV